MDTVLDSAANNVSFSSLVALQNQPGIVADARARISARHDGVLGMIIARVEGGEERYIPTNPHPVRELVLMEEGLGARHLNPATAKLYFVPLAPEHLMIFGVTCRDVLGEIHLWMYPGT